MSGTAMKAFWSAFLELTFVVISCFVNFRLSEGV
jgi:hypothetical protein